MDRKYCQRKFGNKIATITPEGKICVADEWFTNHGLIYSHNINDLKQGIINPITGFEYQVIGMDREISKTLKNWIYKKIITGKFDHLTEE